MRALVKIGALILSIKEWQMAKKQTDTVVRKELLSQDICIGILKKRGTFNTKSRDGVIADRKLSLEELNKRI